MSRIDEAMKRASQMPHAGRGAMRATESPLRLAEDFTLNEYPLEARGVAVYGDRPGPTYSSLNSF